MNSSELLRMIEILHREKDIDREVLYEAVEGAIASAIKRQHSTEDEIEVRIDRESGEIEVYEGEYLAEYPDMGRIQAQTAKQVIIQKIREAESDVIFSEYEGKSGDLINGTVQRIEGGNVVVNLGRAEGLLPRQERIRGENYQPGERIKAMIYDVQKTGQKVRILLTRASPDFVIKLFELEVPEIGERIIEIKMIAREAGFRTKVAVSSYDMRVDCIGACVGIRGTRIKSITDELNEERIDIIRWNESSEMLIINSMRPAQIHSMKLEEETSTAFVLVPDDQLSLAIGRKGQNVRLASKLTGWDIKIQALSEKGLGGTPSDEEEDPEVTAAREALLKGTSLEAIYSREKRSETEKDGSAGSDEAAESGETAESGDTAESGETAEPAGEAETVAVEDAGEDAEDAGEDAEDAGEDAEDAGEDAEDAVEDAGETAEEPGDNEETNEESAGEEDLSDGGEPAPEDEDAESKEPSA